jgi:hypothetical protein
LSEPPIELPEPLASLSSAVGYLEGQFTLSLDPQPAAADRNSRRLASGPTVSCERRTLDDGTVVWVGHGDQDGVERVSVEYLRPDGSVVWATADEATDGWWNGNHGADPLTSPPMSVDDLIDMASDPAVK